MTLRLLTSALLAIALSAATLAQIPRDSSREATGHAVLTGRVVDPGHPEAGIRRVDVTLTGGSLVSPRTTRTDDEGRFVFDALAAGTYRVRTRKTGFVAADFGASKPGRPGLSIVLADTDRRDVVISMPRGAAISGTVSDETGSPLADARVTVLRGQTRYGARAFIDTLIFADSDDRGAYRIAGLDAGEYVVVAARADFNRRPPDFTSMAEGEVDLATRDAIATTTAAVSPAPRRTFGFAPVYYPNATSAANATPIIVALGEERTGADLTVGVAPVARIDGIVAGAGDRPVAGALVSLLPRGSTDSVAASQYAPGGLLVPKRTDAEGHFVFAGVDPGDYVLTVSTGPVPGRGAPAAQAPDQAIAWASVDLAVNGEDQTVTLGLQTARTIAGQLVFDGTTAPPADLSNTRLSIRAAQSRTPSSLVNYETPGHAEHDGRFTIPGVIPGSYWLTATAPGSTETSGWALTSVLVGGRETLDVPIDVGGQSDVTDVIVRFTDHPSGVEGTLQTAAGAPASDYFIVVFPKDPSMWRPGSRRIAMARPNSTGGFAARNLPAGDYLIAALTDVEDGEWFDADFLAQLVPAAKAFTIRQGEVTRQELRIGG